MKYLLLLIPGLGDVPQTALRDTTPLEAADAPVLNQLAREGQAGRVNSIPKGMPPSTLASMLTLLGYPPGPYLTGRGWFEALSAGAELADDEWVFRLQLVSMDQGVLTDPRGAAPTEAEAAALLATISSVCSPLGWRFLPGYLHSHLAISSGDFSETLIESPWDLRDQKPSEHPPEGKGASALLKLIETAGAALATHPVNHARKAAGKPLINGVWPWGGGCDVDMPGFSKTFGKHAAMVSASALTRGVAVATGMELPDPDNPSRRYFRDPSGRMKRVAREVKSISESLAQTQPIEASAQAEGSAPTILDSALSIEDLASAKMREEHGGVLMQLLATAQKSLVDTDFVVVDIEHIREASLEDSPLVKRLAIELFDELFLAPLIASADADELRIALVSSISIDSSEHRNLPDASPFLIWGANVDPCNVPVFNERVLEKSAPLIDQGVSFIDTFLSAS